MARRRRSDAEPLVGGDGLNRPRQEVWSEREVDEARPCNLYLGAHVGQRTGVDDALRDLAGIAPDLFRERKRTVHLSVGTIRRADHRIGGVLDGRPCNLGEHRAEEVGDGLQWVCHIDLLCQRVPVPRAHEGVLCYKTPMAFRRRKQDPNPASPPTNRDHRDADVATFWAWWTTNADRFAEVIEQRGDLSTLASELSDRLSNIGPDLEWELMPGQSANHALCITAAGDPNLHSTVARLFAAAPEPTERWEYLSARPADPNASELALSIGPANIAYTDLRFGVTEFQGTLDVVIYHPAFADLPENARSQISFLALDSFLGELVTERWIGEIVPTSEPILDPVHPSELAAVVDDFATQHPDPTWVLLRGTLANGDPFLVRSMRPLRWSTYPRLDLHAEIEHSYTEHNDGLPAGEARDRLIAFEDLLDELDHDRVQIVTVVTGGCKQQVHVYCDSQSDARAAVERVVDAAPGATVTWTADPAWDEVAEYR